jgi:hypothetical protein
MDIPKTSPIGVKLAFKRGGQKAVEKKYRVAHNNGSIQFIRKKTEIPLPKSGYTEFEDLPDDVQELPGSGALYWMECYNLALKAAYPEIAKDLAWKAVKRRYYCKQGVWRAKMDKVEKVGTFKATMSAKIRKAKRGGKAIYYIEGKASDTSIDLEDDRMGPEFIKTMQETAVGLNIYVDHDHSLDKTVGVIVEAGGDEDNFLIKARLEDPEKNEDVAKLISKSDTGINIGFSIGGRILKAVKAFDELLGRSVRSIVKGILAEVSVTTMPANVNALGAELSMAKSLSKALDDLENEGVFDTEYEEIVKILEEVFEMDQVRRALGNLTWSFIDLNLDIVHSSDLTPDQKKEKILQVAGEFADVVASLSTQLADLIAEQENFLEAGEAA